MQVKVFWPAMGRWYIGKVSTFDAKFGKHTVQFKDGDKREYTMRHEAVVWLDVPGLEGASAAARLEPGWQDEEVCILASAPPGISLCNVQILAIPVMRELLQQPGWKQLFSGSLASRTFRHAMLFSCPCRALERVDSTICHLGGTA